MFVYGFPETLDETISSLHAFIRPLERLLRWRREHREKACSIGAELVDQCLWVDAVVLGLRHRNDAAGLHGLPIGPQDRADFCNAAAGALVRSEIAVHDRIAIRDFFGVVDGDLLDIGRIEILDSPGFRLAE